jgi:Uma2 family endonuclease
MPVASVINSSSAFIALRLRPAVTLTDDQFFSLCRQNRDVRLERTAEGDLIVMPPTGGETGNRNSEIGRQLANWTKRNGDGRCFDSSTGFRLPNGANRSPDAAWVSRARLHALTPEQKRAFLPLAPDFVIELRSPTDDLAALRAKMDEYLAVGVRLGWLIDPEVRRVHVYAAHAAPLILENPDELHGDPVLPGFTLDLRDIWDPNI